MIRSITIAAAIFLTACQMNKEHVDLLVKDAMIYTVDESFSVIEAFVVKDGRIYDTGSSSDMEMKYTAKSTISLKDHFIYPGWYDAHSHFVSYGLSLKHVDLTGTSSVNEILERCIEYAKNNPEGWITGRGWDQNDWQDKKYPDKTDLDKVFPDRPVLLKRIDGHAGWANSAALQMAGVNRNSSIEGGNIIFKKGEPSGILIDNAIELVGKIVPEPDKKELISAIKMAEENCFAVGLTSVTEAGLPTGIVQLIDSLQRNKSLKMRVNAWLEPSESNFKTYIEKGKLQNDMLTVNTIKLYADGALGSRGARMIEPYTDDPGNSGLFVTDYETLKSYCQRALENNYQVATHCIGDAANRRMLNLYAELLNEGNDRRWRIEHAQIIHPDDFYLFGKYNIIPSVQPTHATSDMYWVVDRIGENRLKGAYSYKTLLNELGWIPLGSDFPIESINPLYGFYAAISRKDQSGYPEEGFRKEEALSREEALRGMTIWAAKAAFEDEFKGSIEKGKLADFVVTDQDIMTAEESQLPDIEVLQTYSSGELIYEKQE